MDGKKQVDRFHPGALVRFIIPARGYFQNLDPGGPWRNTHSRGNAPLLNSLSQLAKRSPPYPEHGTKAHGIGRIIPRSLKNPSFPQKFTNTPFVLPSLVAHPSEVEPDLDVAEVRGGERMQETVTLSFEGMQPYPRQGILTAQRIPVIGLMHAPKEGIIQTTHLVPLPLNTVKI
jgi:hypothetical protein